MITILKENVVRCFTGRSLWCISIHIASVIKELLLLNCWAGPDETKMKRDGWCNYSYHSHAAHCLLFLVPSEQSSRTQTHLIRATWVPWSPGRECCALTHFRIDVWIIDTLTTCLMQPSQGCSRWCIWEITLTIKGITEISTRLQNKWLIFIGLWFYSKKCGFYGAKLSGNSCFSD